MKMMGSFALRALWVVTTLMMATSTAMAQTNTLATLMGKVVDESGATLPGVLITVKGPALQVPQMTDLTDGDGSYRIRDLPIGTYRVSYELSGFQTVIQEDLRLSTGFSGRVDVTLKIGALQESVTVSGHSPVVDTVNTATSTTFQREVLESAPKGKGMWEVYLLASGVSAEGKPDVGDSNLATRQGIKSYGVASIPTIEIEGINGQTDNAANSAMFISYFPMEEVQVKASGNDSEVGTPGVHVVAVMKSGGNAFHGGFETAYETPKLQADNLTPALRAQGLSQTEPLDFYYDFAGDIGGRVVRDKLWFYGGVSRQADNRGRIGFAKAPGSDGIYLTADDVPGTRNQYLDNRYAKMTGQVSRSTKLIGSLISFLKTSDAFTAARLVPLESSTVQDDPGRTWKGEVQTILKENLLINALAGHSFYAVDYFAQPGAAVAGNPSRLDSNTGLRTGPAETVDHRPSSRFVSRGTVTYLPKEHLWGGAHQLKAGAIVTNEGASSHNLVPANGDYQLIDLNGRPDSISTFNSPTSPQNRMDSAAIFASDTYTLSHLTLNLGLRWERYNAFYPDQRKEAGPFSAAFDIQGKQLLTWHLLAPRLGAAWDVRGNGKTVVKATFGRYGDSMGNQFAQRFNPNARVITTYRWRDLNGNNDYDTGEVNLAPNGPDYLRASGGVNQLPNPDLQQPTTTEYVARLERELMANTALSLTYVRKDIKGLYNVAGANVARPYSAFNIPVDRIDPGPDGVAGNGDDGGPFTIWTFPASFAGSTFNQLQMVNAPDSRNDGYHTIETTFTKRYSQKLNVLTSFWVTKNHRWIDATPVSPNDELFPIDDTWNWEGRLTVSYEFPHAVQLSGTVRASSGQYGQRLAVFGSIPQLGSATLRMEPFGTQQYETLSLTNVRANKKIHLTKSLTLDGRVEVFNIFNSATVISANTLSGRSFNYATNIISPRIVRFGFAVVF